MRPTKRKQSEGERIGSTALMGGLGGLFTGNPVAGAIGGSLSGAAAQGLGDALLGHPDEHGFLKESGRGALGGGLLGAVGGPLALGTTPGGGALLKALIAKGMSKNKAMAVLMGAGALGGSLGGAMSKGLDSGLANMEYD